MEKSFAVYSVGCFMDFPVCSSNFSWRHQGARRGG